MKKIIWIILILSSYLLFGYSVNVEARTSRTKSSDVYVKGYTKKNGTYVAPHYRSAPDSIISNNYSCIDYWNCGTNSASTNYTTPSANYSISSFNSPSFTELCQKSYGKYSIATSDNQCSCMAWYNRDNLGKSCIKNLTPSELCQKEYWFNSYSNWTKLEDWSYSCSCDVWYYSIWSDNKNKRSCVKPIEWCQNKYWSSYYATSPADFKKSDFDCIICEKWNKISSDWLSCEKDLNLDMISSYGITRILRDVNLRGEPSINSEIIQIINKDTVVEKSNYKEIEWVKRYNIKYNWVEWWVHSIAFKEDTTKKASLLEIRNDVNLRNSPTVKWSKVIQIIYKGSYVQELWTKDVNWVMWYNIIYWDQKWWINAIAFN